MRKAEAHPVQHSMDASASTPPNLADWRRQGSHGDLTTYFLLKRMGKFRLPMLREYHADLFVGVS